jgi:pimeloyl-ACP methyl ester carboxylesterase
VAIVVGESDRVVPEKFGRRLYDSYAGPKRLWTIPQGSHESIHQQAPEFWTEVRAFWLANPVS